MTKKVELLWSGGWDSTFRLCQLARESDVDVQPYYLKLPRSGWEEELKTIPRIWELLQKHPKRRAQIRPVIYIEKDDLPIPDDIEASWQRFRGEPYELGGQYRRIAVFARKHPGIELGQERYYKKLGHLRKLLLEKGHMKLTKDQVGYFDKNDCDPDVYNLFGNLSLPICEMHEPQMAKLIHRWGFEDIMDHVWFCYTPVNGEPCGLCVPCLTKHKNGMYKLLPAAAIQRASVYKRLQADKRNNALPEGRKLHQLFANVFKMLRDMNMPCDVQSILLQMQKPESIQIMPLPSCQNIKNSCEAKAENPQHIAQLEQVLEMYRDALAVSGFEQKVLPEEIERLESKIKEVEAKVCQLRDAENSGERLFDVIY